MISSIFHPGSGTGDQLFRYITARTLALDKGLEFGMVCPENFKGKDFIKIDYGVQDPFETRTEMPSGKVIITGINPDISEWVKIEPIKLWEEKTLYYNPEINFVEDGIIDGNFQDERYWGHRLGEIREWLKVEPLEMPDDLCVINFRGGEFATVPELFLPIEYWYKAIDMLADKYNGNIKFEVHTDDEGLAKQFFPTFKAIHNVGLNWRSIRYAKHLVLANSAFGIIPALLNENVKEVIAPRYWARRNIQQWHLPQNYYKKFTYI